ncbi:MAG: T9SS type B sorting domain-containing protein [Flavobacterium sp.]|nr:T9SS type B sorting domain-containing protein [Flavobacterium sp.]
MKKLIFIVLIIPTLVFSQQEASVWYFGQNAGLKFETNGSVTPLSNGQLDTEEGCSSIADGTGNLLFYTDGRTVWDRNHIPMLNGSFANGTELHGDSSSTQSAIIVPKPNDPNIYYVFTVDEPHHENALVYPNAFVGSYAALGSGSVPITDDGRNNGFNYSVIDLSVTGSNGSIGNIVSRNNHLVTYDTNPTGEEIKYKCAEKITAIKNEVDGSYWVITHFINKFFAFKVTSSGVITSPVISAVGSNQTLLGYRRNAIGYLKASPDGRKLAIAHSENGTVLGNGSFGTGNIELFNFDGATGIVSNPITVLPNVQAYGVEFSPNSEKLYATYRVDTNVNMELSQFDILATDIPNSKVIIDNQQNYLFSLQLAPNNKIYCATAYVASMGVINNPNSIGLACNYVQDGQPVTTNTLVKLGLPPFITSFFNASFTVENFCLGSATQFTLNSTTGVTSVSWDFGDGSPLSNVLNPSHNYLTAGNYTVTLTATAANGTSTKTRTITIAAIPVVANTVANQIICGTDNMSYSLAPFTTTLLGSQSNTLYGVTYFLSSSDATNHVNVLPINYSLPLGVTTFYAKIHSITHISCYVLTSFTITLYLQPVATTPNAIFSCDDSSNDGIGNFDLQSVKATVLGTQNATLYTVSFHLNQNDADTNSNALALNYQNIANPQTIFIRIENNQQTSCFATTSFQIGLYKMPIANQPQDMFLCDDGNDGIETFVLTPQTSVVLGTQLATEFSVSYHSSSIEANNGFNSLGADFVTTSNDHTIYVRIQNNLNPTCFAITSFQLQLKAEPILNIDETYSICEGNSIAVSAPTGFSSYLWSNGDTTPTAHITQAGNYSLTVTKNYGSISCSTSQDFVVYNSNVATITQIITTDWTDNQNSITVVVTGDGDYEYSLDGIEYQDSNTFYGLQNGQYTVYVNDKKECGFRTQEVFLLIYPKFFTPNGDGIHDTWQIKFSFQETNMELIIFDRYGKLIKRFKGTDLGWDGTLNGKLLFADDYWFVVKRQNGKEHRGHFSLKR